MTIEFICKNCQKDILINLASADSPIVCQHCSHEINFQLSDSLQKGEKVNRCALCSKIRFYVQKDFNPRLGLIIFAIGVIFSYHTYGLTLLIATIIDIILYKVLQTVTICYNCRAIYRGFKEDPTHRGFDHNLVMTLAEQNKKVKIASETSVA